MAAAIPAAISLLAPQGWLAILTTAADAENLKALASRQSEFQWQPPQPISTNANGILLLGQGIPHSTH